MPWLSCIHNYVSCTSSTYCINIYTSYISNIQSLEWSQQYVSKQHTSVVHNLHPHLSLEDAEACGAGAYVAYKSGLGWWGPKGSESDFFADFLFRSQPSKLFVWPCAESSKIFINTKKKTQMMQKKTSEAKNMIFEMHRIAATVCFPIFQKIYFETTHSSFPGLSASFASPVDSQKQPRKTPEGKRSTHKNGDVPELLARFLLTACISILRFYKKTCKQLVW